MQQDEFKVVAELYRFLATFDAKAIAAATKLPNISDNLRDALMALHAESNAPRQRKNVRSPQSDTTEQPQATDPVQILTDKTKFPGKSELEELAGLLGVKLDAGPKDSRERVARKLAKTIVQDERKLKEFSKLVPAASETQTSGYVDIIRRGM